MISSRILLRQRTSSVLNSLRQTGRPRLQSTYSQLPPKPRSDSLKTTIVLKLANLLGYNSPRQLLQRNALVLYRQSVKPVYNCEQGFWHSICSLPPTFQTWFTVSNLHIWLLTVRLRALPSPHGYHYIQGLVNHFFEDVEDQIRSRLHKRVSERIITKELKICRDQWQGLGLALDYGLLTSDAELAGAIWRNFLGARGANGIDGHGQAINYAGLEKATDRINRPRDPDADDKSGVRDFEGSERDKYVNYPEVMWTLVSYIRREVARLEGIPNEVIMQQASTGEFGAIQKNMDPIPSFN